MGAKHVNCESSRKKSVLFVLQPQKSSSINLVKYMLTKLNLIKNTIDCFSNDVFSLPQTIEYSRNKIVDCVITIGDHNTLLQCFSMFKFMDSPPIISIADGCEPILYNFSHCDIVDLSDLLLPQIQNDNLVIQHCMKMAVITSHGQTTISEEATCHIELHRGKSLGILKVNISLINHCTNEPINIGMMACDGLLISTPMGSFSRGMSFNGPLMHKEMENFMILPICPLSLKFRPLCLPPNTTLELELDASSRSDATVFLDDRQAMLLQQSGKIRITMSKFKTNMVCNLLQPYQQTFIKGLKNIISWGDNYESKSLSSIKRATLAEYQS